jgi:tRNA pseudouridine38-40 synthase
VFHGWQKQKGSKTIQGELEEAIWKVAGERSKVIGASRTDAGVHATAQVANFKTHSNTPPCVLPAALNSHLPREIVVYEAELVEPDFHARFSAKSRRYTYTLLNTPYPSPFYKDTAFWIPTRLRVEKMKKAAAHLLGRHDFTSFASLLDPRRSPIREITSINIKKRGDFIIIEVEGGSFLPGMIRTMAGALIGVGRGVLDPLDVKKLLEKRKQGIVKWKAPAYGLCLTGVVY